MHIDPTTEQRERTAAIVAAFKGKKFTNEGIAALKATGVEYGVGDAGCEGLRLRVSASGVKTFVYTYRSPVALKTRALTIGQYPDVTLARARGFADEARADVKAGIDPQAVKIEAREATKNALPFREVSERFIASVIAGQRTGHDRTGMLERTGRRFGWDDKPIASITDDEARAQLERLRDRKSFDPETGKTGGGPIAAFAVMSMLRELFKWAKKRKLITVNIFADLEVDGVRKPKRRTRFLTPVEIRLVWSALDTPETYGISHDAALALRLILTTAARPGMVCAMKSGGLHDLDAPQLSVSRLRLVASNDDDDREQHDGAVWILSHAEMKRDDKKYETEEPFIVPLNGLAVSLIKSARGGHTGRVLGSPTPTGNSKMTPGKLARCVRAIVKAHGMPRWTPHDLRRTAASMIGSLNVPGRAKFADHEIGWLLAHKEGRSSVSCTTEIYNRNDHFDEKRLMATMLGIELDKCLRNERVGLDRARYKRAA